MNVFIGFVKEYRRGANKGHTLLTLKEVRVYRRSVSICNYESILFYGNIVKFFKIQPCIILVLFYFDLYLYTSENLTGDLSSK